MLEYLSHVITMTSLYHLLRLLHTSVYQSRVGMENSKRSQPLPTSSILWQLVHCALSADALCLWQLWSLVSIKDFSEQGKGLPVTQAGENPLYLLYSSNHQDMTLEPALISGPGMSRSGPTQSFSACAQHARMCRHMPSQNPQGF